MPFIQIFGLSDLTGFRQDDLGTLICEKVAAIAALGITEKDVTIAFISARLIGERDEIIAKVEGLFERPERDADVRWQVANAVGETIRDSFRVRSAKEGRFIEVLIAPAYHEEQGYWNGTT